DGPLGGQVLDAARHHVRRVTGFALDHGAAVRPHEKPGCFQVPKIVPDGGAGHAEEIAQLHDCCFAMRGNMLENFLLAFLDEQGADVLGGFGADVLGGFGADAQLYARAPLALATISAAVRQLVLIWSHFFSAIASRDAIQVPPTHATASDARYSGRLAAVTPPVGMNRIPVWA